MQEIKPDAGTDVILSRLRVLHLRLLARPDTTALAAPIKSVLTDLKTRFDHWAELHDQRLAAYGMLAFVDDEEDAEIAGLARRVRVLVEGRLDSPLWLRLFPEAPSEATGGVADNRQRTFAEQVIATLAQNPEYASLKDLLPDLLAARAAVAAAREKLHALVVADNQAWTEVQIAETAARAAYSAVHPRLMILFPGRKRLVESFFYKAPRKKKGAPSDPGSGPELDGPDSDVVD